MVATSIPVASAIATSDDTQVESAQETIYVNSYSGNERSIDFNDHWRFYLGDASGAENVIFNDSSWSDVTLPHDYSIDQGFTHVAPAEQESGYVLGGTGWYRKSFIPVSYTHLITWSAANAGFRLTWSKLRKRRAAYSRAHW